MKVLELLRNEVTECEEYYGCGNVESVVGSAGAEVGDLLRFRAR
jgi:hypothetical protein